MALVRFRKAVDVHNAEVARLQALLQEAQVGDVGRAVLERCEPAPVFFSIGPELVVLFRSFLTEA